MLMQDNAPIHRANRVTKWFSKADMDVMDCPALSPDLNPIENIWGVLSRMVHTNEMQLKIVNELNESIKRNWDRITFPCIQGYISSMPKRCLDVLKADGHPRLLHSHRKRSRAYKFETSIFWGTYSVQKF